MNKRNWKYKIIFLFIASTLYTYPNTEELAKRAEEKIGVHSVDCVYGLMAICDVLGCMCSPDAECEQLTTPHNANQHSHPYANTPLHLQCHYLNTYRFSTNTA